MGYALLLSGHPKFEDFLSWCQSNGYPLHHLEEIPFEKVLGFMKKDKKSSGGTLNFVLLQETGVPNMDMVEEERARIVYEEFRLKIREVLV
jgi:3-dehydroquinate synthase